MKNAATKNSWLCSGTLIDQDYVAIGAQCLYKDGWDVRERLLYDSDCCVASTLQK